MTEPGGSSAESGQHWFAGRDVQVLLFRINRRPYAGPETLFDDLFVPPTSVLDHLEEVLRDPRPVDSGRRYKRTWRIGNKRFDHRLGLFTGMIGWARSEISVGNVFNEVTDEWVDRFTSSDITAVAPFAFRADGRYLGILKHSSFEEKTLAHVFQEFLQRGERSRPSFATDWAVEPVGDEQEFIDWMNSVDSVQSVEFIFRRPNPDAEREFEDLFQRLDALEASQIKEVIAARDAERGLNRENLQRDPSSRGFIAAAMVAFGYLVGRGTLDGGKVKYDQRERAAREEIQNVSPSWEGATAEVARAVARWLDRRQRSG